MMWPLLLLLLYEEEINKQTKKKDSSNLVLFFTSCSVESIWHANKYDMMQKTIWSRERKRERERK